MVTWELLAIIVWVFFAILSLWLKAVNEGELRMRHIWFAIFFAPIFAAVQMFDHDTVVWKSKEKKY